MYALSYVITSHLQFVTDRVICVSHFTAQMFISSLSTLITKPAPLLQLQTWQASLAIEGCARHANGVLDLNNMLETRRAGEGGRGGGGGFGRIV